MKHLKGLLLTVILILSPTFASAEWEVVRGDWTVADGVFTQTIADWQEHYQTIITTSNYLDLNASFTVEVLNSPGRERMVACAMRAATPGIGAWGSRVTTFGSMAGGLPETTT